MGNKLRVAKNGKISLQTIESEYIDEKVSLPRQASISNSKKLISNISCDGEAILKRAKPLIPALNIS